MYMYVYMSVYVHVHVHVTHTSMKMEPNGRTPPNITMAHGSMNLRSKHINPSLASFEESLYTHTATIAIQYTYIVV